MQEHPDEAEKIYQENIKRLQQWRKDNPEEYKEKCIKPLLEGNHKWRQEHPDLVQQNMIQVNQAKEKWQKEHPQEHQAQVDKWRQAGSIANSKAVRCITTGMVFNSISEAGRYYGIPQGNISRCLLGNRKSAGKDPETGEKLLWEYVNQALTNE